MLSNYLLAGGGESFSFQFHAVRRGNSRLAKALFSIVSIIHFTLRLMFGRYHVIHAHPSEFYGFYRYLPYYAVAKLFGKKVIFHIHGGRFDKFYSMQPKRMKALIRKTLQGCDAVICLSSHWKDVFSGFKIKQLFVVTNAVTTPDKNEYDVTATSITFIGFVEDKKGIFDLLSAIKLLIPSHEFILEICGSGDDKRLLNTMKQNGLEKYVRFHGWIGEKEKDKILRRTAVFVLPSYAEALPMVLLEAMSYGIPVVTTPVGGIPELIKDVENGMMVPPGNVEMLAKSINILLSDPVLRQKMSASNYLKIRTEYSMLQTTKKLDLIYQSVMKV